jgi:hypothetical protein
VITQVRLAQQQKAKATLGHLQPVPGARREIAGGDAGQHQRQPHADRQCE